MCPCCSRPSLSRPPRSAGLPAEGAEPLACFPPPEGAPRSGAQLHPASLGRLARSRSALLRPWKS
eukprot:12514463-Alexandrium_andersonii.AAC.1